MRSDAATRSCSCAARLHPFNLMFLPDVLGLEYDVEIERITRAEIESGWGRGVRLEFGGRSGARQDVTLYLKDPTAFIGALGRRSV